MRLALLACGQMHGELATHHPDPVGILEGGLGTPGVCVLNVGVVVLLECAFDHLAVAAEQVLDLALIAGERKVGYIQFGWNDRGVLRHGARIHIRSCIRVVVAV